MTGINRRKILSGASAALTLGLLEGALAPMAIARPATAPFRPLAGPRTRVMFVNDLSGDIDGLYAAAHQIISSSADLRAIVGTSTGRPGETSERSAELAREMLALMKLTGRVPVHAGGATRLPDLQTPVRSAGTQAIIDEALRDDTDLPLFVAVGGGLTEVASAVMIEPRVAERVTLVWIGGDALPSLGTGETNFNIDPLAARYLFNQTQVRIWQVTREAYKNCVVSATSLQAHLSGCGKIGPWLIDRLSDVSRKYGLRLNTGETWTLGDNPLVLLTALTGWAPSNRAVPLRFESTDSSRYEEYGGVTLREDGTIIPGTGSRSVRIYREIDVRLMMDDFFAKMQMNFGRA